MTSSRERENIEWSITYSFNATDIENPRVLMIGDSICNAYEGTVREILKNEINVSFWASSKCVTDKDYFKELDLILSAYSYDMITFNNTLHSLNSDRKEWENAFQQAVAFIRHKYPNAVLFLVTGTPVNSPEQMEALLPMNRFIRAFAEQNALPLIDLFAETDKLPKENLWSDIYHFLPHVIKVQGAFMAEHIRSVNDRKNTIKSQKGTALGPNGALE